VVRAGVYSAGASPPRGTERPPVVRHGDRSSGTVTGRPARWPVVRHG